MNHQGRPLGGLALVLVSAVTVLGGLAVARPTPSLARDSNAVDLPPTPASASMRSDETGTTRPASADEAPERATCSIDDPGPGRLRTGPLGIANGRLHLPERVEDGFTLVVHFHGGEAVRKLLAVDSVDVVLATIDAGAGSTKYAASVDASLPKRLLQAVESKTDRKVGQVVLSSWSAGYAAIREWLRVAPDSAQAYVLLDSVHTSRDPGGALSRGPLEPFLELATRAAGGTPFVWLTHSAIVPPNFASTTDVADAIVSHVGAQRKYAGLEPHHGVELATRADHGALHVRGYSGNDNGAHCAHLKLLPAILEREVLPYLRR